MVKEEKEAEKKENFVFGIFDTFNFFDFLCSEKW